MVQWSLKLWTATFVIFQTATSVLQLSCNLLSWVCNTFQIQFQILNILDKLDIFQRQASLVRCNIYDGTVQFFDFNVELIDGNFQFLYMFDAQDLFFGHWFHLCEQFVYFSLEFGFFFFSSAKVDFMKAKKEFIDLK